MTAYDRSLHTVALCIQGQLDQDWTIPFAPLGRRGGRSTWQIKCRKLLLLQVSCSLALCSTAPISRYIQISVKVVRIMDKCKSHPYKVVRMDGRGPMVSPKERKLCYNTVSKIFVPPSFCVSASFVYKKTGVHPVLGLKILFLLLHQKPCRYASPCALSLPPKDPIAYICILSLCPNLRLYHLLHSIDAFPIIQNINDFKPCFESHSEETFVDRMVIFNKMIQDAPNQLLRTGLYGRSNLLQSNKIVKCGEGVKSRLIPSQQEQTEIY